jgi:hypothetical protein
MRSLLLISALTAVALDGVHPNTAYVEERELVIESECTLEMEMVAFEIVRDGEPMDMGDRGGSGSSETRSVVIRDTIQSVDKEGVPTAQLRAFESVELSSTMMMRDEEMEDEREGRLHEVTLSLTIEDDEVSCEVEDGVEPDEEEALEGHTLGLGMDAALPGEEVEEGDSWELENDAVRSVLGLDVERALFGGRPATAEGEEGGRGRGGRGGRGMRGRSSGGFSTLVQAEWEGEATLESAEAELDDVKCCIIALSFEASGEFEPPEREGGFGGRGRGGRSLELSNESLAVLVGVTYEAEFEGKLWFSLEENRPLQMEIEGDVSVISESVREWGESSIEMYSETEGEFELTVTVTEE